MQGNQIKASVAFVTSCWEANWEVMLKTDYLARMIDRNCYSFAERILIINNVALPSTVAAEAQRLVREDILTHYYLAADHSAAALTAYQVQLSPEQNEVPYLVADLVAVHLVKSDYIVRFSSDCILEKSADWITTCLPYLARDHRILCACPLWSDYYRDIREEFFLETVNFYYGHRFSDQCYLIQSDRFRRPIYNEYHAASVGFPAHAGNSFERRCDAYLNNQGHYKIVSKEAIYHHRTFAQGFFAQRKQLQSYGIIK